MKHMVWHGVLGTFEWGCTMNDRGHGWILFAAIVLGVAGIMRIFDAIWAFRYHGAVPQHLEDAIFGTSLKTYGWVYLIVGIILILCGLAVMGAPRSAAGSASRPGPSVRSAPSGGCPTTRSGP